MSRFEVMNPRQVVSRDDGIFSILDDSFITTDLLFAKAVARQLDEIDPRYIWVSEDDSRYQRSREKHLSQLRVGSYAWTLPWAMWQDINHRWWLHPEYPAEVSYHGTVRMLVKRQSSGYIVYYRYDDDERQLWSPTKSPGYDADYWIPVLKRRCLREFHVRASERKLFS